MYYSLGEEINDKKFPTDFMFGVATASYQVEGITIFELFSLIGKQHTDNLY